MTMRPRPKSLKNDGALELRDLRPTVPESVASSSAAYSTMRDSFDLSDSGSSVRGSLDITFAHNCIFATSASRPAKCTTIAAQCLLAVQNIPGPLDAVAKAHRLASVIATQWMRMATAKTATDHSKYRLRATPASQLHAITPSCSLSEPLSMIEADRHIAERHISAQGDPVLGGGVVTHAVPDLEEQAAAAQRCCRTSTKLVLLFILSWLLNVANAFQRSMVSNLAPYVSSELGGHGFTTSVFVIVETFKALAYLFSMKLLKTINRFYLFTAGALLSIIGLGLLSGAGSIQMYCAGNILYHTGWAAIAITVNSLLYESTMWTQSFWVRIFTSSPAIITAFAGSPLAQYFNSSHWRWGYRALLIVLLAGSIPTGFVMCHHMQLISNRTSADAHISSTREVHRDTWCGITWYYLVHRDGFSATLLVIGLSLLLAAFFSAESTAKNWHTPHVIGMIAGCCTCLLLCGAVERSANRPSFFPIQEPKDRTVLGACGLSLVSSIALNSWDSYFTSHLQVVHNMPMKEAGWVAAINDGVEAIAAVPIVLLACRLGYFKPLLELSFGLYCFGLGSLFLVRKPGVPASLIVVSQVWVGAAGATFNLLDSVAVTSTRPARGSDHSAKLALLLMSSSLGSAVGKALSTVVWNSTLPRMLRLELPDSDKEYWALLYKSLPEQLRFGEGHPIRVAIQTAYVEAQETMLIGGLLFMLVGLGCISLMRNNRVPNAEAQTAMLPSDQPGEVDPTCDS